MRRQQKTAATRRQRRRRAQTRAPRTLFPPFRLVITLVPTPIIITSIRVGGIELFPPRSP